jgi:myo-inositol-1(or 4)-monophosphatase
MQSEDDVRLTEIEPFLNQLGDEARALAMQHFRTEIDVETKSDATPVTKADRAIERRLREVIASRYPTHVLVGEEEGGRIADGICWVIDPIDGTKSFVTGLPLFGTLVAMLEDRRPVCGMVEAPAMRERWIGVADRTSRNGEPCMVSACAHLRDARLCSTDPRMFSGEAARAFATLAREVRVTRFGTDCYGYAMLASGHVDLVVEDGLQAHDVMAIVRVASSRHGLAMLSTRPSKATSLRLRPNRCTMRRVGGLVSREGEATAPTLLGFSSVCAAFIDLLWKQVLCRRAYGLHCKSEKGR